jgi:hypothetical protein
VQLREVWIRFYKSFNFDYELKANPGAEGPAWQTLEGVWWPHVRIRLSDDVTAVVGANESGKTHLLDAIDIALTGTGLRKRDFCRYSTLFSVERGERLYPEVGATLVADEEEAETLVALGIPLRKNGDVIMLRSAPNTVVVVDDEDERQVLTREQSAGLQQLLPVPHWLNTRVALPDAVSIAALAGSDDSLSGRRRRFELLKLLAAILTADDITTNAAALLALLQTTTPLTEEAEAAQDLGKLLLVKVARIEQSSFIELLDALQNEREGLVNGLIQEMNNSLARHLNISRWWSQDSEFQLRVSPREHELVFTIRDRTGTDYSFTERSRGLTYFLSYYVQLLAHDLPVDRTEVLLMDEPDAYLSASGQQDLLRVLENHARPEDSDRLDQVVYVTHSPFLIDRNAGHRVRVVDKGSKDEGTRLVKDATQASYEPLRSSLGALFAETAFIGGDNLFVEGISDQVYLAGMNSRLLRTGWSPSDCIDLNRVTIVPSGADVPYMLYLARGRDKVKPPCAALLDSDSSGETMQRQIRRGGARGRPAIGDDLIVMLGDWAASATPDVAEGVTVREPEDLVPLAVAVAAARGYAVNLLGLSETDAKRLSDQDISSRLEAANGSLWDALEAAFVAAFETDITKAGFAKEVIAYASRTKGNSRPVGVPALDANFAALIKTVSATLTRAREREFDERRDHRLERIIDSFTADHPIGCKRDVAAATLSRVEAAVDNTSAGDIIRGGAAQLRRDFELDKDPLKNVSNYGAFVEGLRNLRHLERLEYQKRLGSAGDD